VNKVLLGLVLGAILGAIDGMTAWWTPEVRAQIAGIVIGSTVKGIIAGVLIGVFARKVQSIALGIGFGLAVGLLLAFIVAQMQHGSSGTPHSATAVGNNRSELRGGKGARPDPKKPVRDKTDAAAVPRRRRALNRCLGPLKNCCRDLAFGK
jgi:hypothetical protein